VRPLPARKAPFWLLFAGVVINVILIAVAGFWVMLACSLWAVASYRRMTGSTTRRVSARRAGKKAARRQGAAGWQAGGLGADGLEERWRRRQEGAR